MLPSPLNRDSVGSTCHLTPSPSSPPSPPPPSSPKEGGKTGCEGGAGLSKWKSAFGEEEAAAAVKVEGRGGSERLLCALFLGGWVMRGEGGKEGERDRSKRYARVEVWTLKITADVALPKGSFPYTKIGS